MPQSPYCWGDASATREIFVDGYLFQATTNLYAALKLVAERAKSKFLWIDTICINQSSIEEKNRQVPLMSALYSQANRILDWLSEEADDSSLAIAFLQRWADAIDKARKASEKDLLANPLTAVLKFHQFPLDETSWKVVGALVHRPYWNRIWIIQETVMARDRMILYGRDEIHYDRFHHAYGFFQELLILNNDNQVDSALAFKLHISVLTVKTIMDIILQKAMKKRHGERYQLKTLNLIARASLCFATNPRDKIYGILELVSDSGHELNPDHSLSLEEVSIAFVHAEIQSFIISFQI